MSAKIRRFIAAVEMVGGARSRAGRCFGMERIAGGRAHCALCGEAIRPGEDALVTPDYIADDTDPFWRFADAPMHRACFLVWDRRKAFIASYNRVARQLLAPDGSYPRMTSEGEIVASGRGRRGLP